MASCVVRRGGDGCGAGEGGEATSVSDEGVDVQLRRGKRGVGTHGLRGMTKTYRLKLCVASYVICDLGWNKSSKYCNYRMSENEGRIECW